MRKTLLIVAMLFTAFSAHADVLEMPPAAAPLPAAVPKKGDSMTEVSQQFGAPAQKHPPAGGDTRRHPPITRWDYPGFSVFFEKKLVVDVVLPGAPAPVSNVEELKQN